MTDFAASPRPKLPRSGLASRFRAARARAGVRLEAVLDTILSAHAYPLPITNLLAEALALTALAGSLLKDDGSQATMQAQTEDGPVRLLVCDSRGDELRGYVDFDADKLAALGANPSLAALFGQGRTRGHLALTFDLANGKGRYQGIVPLEGASLAQAVEGYFTQSEQVPTLIRLAIETGPGHRRAAALLLQHLPEGEEGRERLHTRFDHPEWEHVATLAGSLRHGELLDPDLSLDAIVWRLFHEEDEVRVFAGPPIARGCRCSRHITKMSSAAFPKMTAPQCARSGRNRCRLRLLLAAVVVVA